MGEFNRFSSLTAGVSFDGRSALDNLVGAHKPIAAQGRQQTHCAQNDVTHLEQFKQVCCCSWSRTLGEQFVSLVKCVHERGDTAQDHHQQLATLKTEHEYVYLGIGRRSVFSGLAEEIRRTICNIAKVLAMRCTYSNITGVWAHV